MAVIGESVLVDQVPVTEHVGINSRISYQGYGIGGHYIGAVREPGNTAKTLGFALGGKLAAKFHKALVAPVDGRTDHNNDHKLATVWQIADAEPVVPQLIATGG